MKYCWECKETKDDSSFSKNKSQKDGLNQTCKICDKLRKREYRKSQKYKDTYPVYSKEYRSRVHVKKRTKEWRKLRLIEHQNMVAEIKSKGCSVCGYFKCIKALEFHHLHPEKDKEDIVSKMVNSIIKKERILAEIAKCALLCSNCHREVHSGIIKL